MPEPLLEVRDLHAWYGESHILHGVDFEIRPGDMVTLLGRNGAGKTTTLKSIMGIVGRRRGSERFTVLLVEQNFRFAATVADRRYVMEHGRVVDMIPNGELDANMNKLHDYLGV